VTARTLVLSGRHDPVLPPSFQEVIARGVSGPVVWKVLELSGHMIFQEQPNASAAAVLEFLRIPAQQPAQTPAL
jgi:pimeloyl-ACP methyl ester carboxylesterase